MTLVGRFVALGTVVELHAPRSIAGLLSEALGDLETDAPTATRVEIHRNLFGRWSVRTDAGTEALQGGADVGFYEAIGAISDIAARSAATTDIVLHAGSVDVAGTAIALAGPSGAGKSTLTAALALAGHAFLTDEVTAIDSDRMVRVFHRPVGLRADGAAALGIAIPAGPYEFTYPLRIGDVGRLGIGASLGVIVLVRRQDSPAAADLLDAPQALFQLANTTLGSSGNERAMFQRLADLVRSVPVYEVRYSDVLDGVRFVEDLVAAGRT